MPNHRYEQLTRLHPDIDDYRLHHTHSLHKVRAGSVTPWISHDFALYLPHLCVCVL